MATIGFSFAILHLLLFALYPRQRGNLYYSLFLICYAVNNLAVGVSLIHHYGAAAFYLIYILVHVCLIFQVIPLLAFLYTDFEPRIPRYIWFFAAAASLYILLFIFFRGTFSLLFSDLVLMGVVIEITRIMVRAIRRRSPDAWIVAVGIFLYDITLLKEFASDFLFDFSPNVVTVIDAVGSLGLPLLITIYLARQFARTSTRLDAQLVKQVEHEREKTRFAIVEAENERRAKELEEARQLQLSMLPKKLPVIPNLEIAAYMKPATEVGGDYYDFHVA